jgi:tRNA A-37 threonylcarbamoyl transferase component Bud32
LTKQELLVLITQKLGTLPSSPKYKIGPRIGNTGKDAKTFSVHDKDGNEYAMKTFKKNKSSDRIEQEAKFQKRCANAGISPRIIDYDTQEKFIVMEKMDGHLYNIIETHQGLVSEKIQKQVLDIFKKLDKVGVFHGDANIMNYMYKGGKMFIIDFGFSKEIDDVLIKKLETQTPNMDIMLLGFILKLKEMNCPPSSYSVLSKFVRKEKREELGI